MSTIAKLCDLSIANIFSASISKHKAMPLVLPSAHLEALLVFMWFYQQQPCVFECCHRLSVINLIAQISEAASYQPRCRHCCWSCF